MKTRRGLVSFGAPKQASLITVKSVAQMVTLKNDDQGFASSNRTGTIYFYQSKVESCVILLFVCLFDLILYVPPTIFQL